MVKNPPSNSGDAGSIPGQGIKIAHPWGNKAHGQQLERSLCTELDREKRPKREIKSPCTTTDPIQPK